ncbi:hypothetical protein [Flavivirga jejuensis]|uniref:Uncharacterized protein n=1 Tax=Flavivirga jejuensis TaxID=870487 RepID=A0ABT8WPK6_9FLAO|nr:hypothetical protein [Flavivirga jejuensis]MDO5974919.1 hypothetical protein [Flavivirga jejuensis]
MYTQVEKSKENKSKVIANSITQKKSIVKKGSRLFDNRSEAVIEKKRHTMSDNPLQRVVIANGTITAPGYQNPLFLGQAVHAAIKASYLGHGFAGAGNQRVVDQNVPSGHIPNLGVAPAAGGALSRFGEVVPVGSEAHGRNKINTIVGAAINGLGLGNQVNVPAWSAGVAIPIATIDPGGNTTNAANTITVAQDGARVGLYVYSG